MFVQAVSNNVFNRIACKRQVALTPFAIINCSWWRNYPIMIMMAHWQSKTFRSPLVLFPGGPGKKSPVTIYWSPSIANPVYPLYTQYTLYTLYTMVLSSWVRILCLVGIEKKSPKRVQSKGRSCLVECEADESHSITFYLSSLSVTRRWLFTVSILFSHKYLNRLFRR